MAALSAAATPPPEPESIARHNHAILPRHFCFAEFSQVEHSRSDRGRNELIAGRITGRAEWLSASVECEISRRTAEVAALRGGRIVQWQWTGRDPDPRAALRGLIGYAVAEDPASTIRDWVMKGSVNFDGSFFREAREYLAAIDATTWAPAETAESIVLFTELPADEPPVETSLARIDTAGLNHTFGLRDFIDLETDTSLRDNAILTGWMALPASDWHAIANWERALRVNRIAPAHGGNILHWHWKGRDPNPQAALLWLIAHALNREPRATLRGWLVVGRTDLHGSFFKETEDFGVAWTDTMWPPTDEAVEILVFLERPRPDPAP
jgi:hypothetical protein